MSYPEPFAIVDEKVRPERQRTRPDGSYVLRKPLPQRWWQFAEKQPAMQRAISGLRQVVVIARVSRTGIAVIVPTGQVFSEKVVIFASGDPAFLSMLNSEVHMLWARRYSSTLKSDLQYTATDCFETFAQPELTERMHRVGAELHEFRRSVMLGRELGLTKLYNRVHDDSVDESDIVRLREIHVEVDEAVAEAYGWDDLDLRHGFYDTRQGRRFTIDPVVQVEILDRLLELNFARYEEEVKAGRHSTKRKAGKAAKVSVPAREDGMLF